VKAKALVVALFSRSGIASRSQSSCAFSAPRAAAGVDGNRLSSRSLRSVPSVASTSLLVLIASLAFLSTTASADSRIGGANEGPLSYLAGGIESPNGLAVSKKEGGDVYVTTGNWNQRIDQFESDGTFVRAIGWGIVPGAVAGTGTVSAGSRSISNVTTTLGAFATGAFNGAGKIITGAGIPPNTQITKVTSTDIEISKPAIASGTGVALSVVAGPGNVPTNEQQELTVQATAGEFKLSFLNPNPGSTFATTTNLHYNAEASEVQSALEALANIGAGNVSVTEGPGDETGATPYLIEFKGRYADTNVRELSTVNVGLSGGDPSSSATITTPTEGGGTLETCTTSCGVPSAVEGTAQSGNGPIGSAPGQLNYSDEIAVDNDSNSNSYGDVYVVDQRNFRVEKYGPHGEFLLMFGGEVNETKHSNICTAADLIAGDTCGPGVPGTGPSHFYKEEPQTVAGGFKSWGNEGSNSITVAPTPGEPNTSTVYVGDFGRIQEFGEGGTFTGEFVLPDAEPRFVSSLAADSAGNVYERSTIFGNEGQIVSQVNGVREFNSSHVLVRTFDTESGSDPRHVAVDSSGDVFVSDYNGGNFQFRAFRPAGTLYAVFTSDQVEGLFPPEPQGMAIDDGLGDLYVSDNRPEGAHIAVVPLPTTGPPGVTKEEATDIQPTTATLHGVVNPRGFDTEYHFEYVDQASFESEGGFASLHTHKTTETDLGLVNRGDPVQAAISGLATGSVYHYRIVAKSHCNESVPSEVCVTDGADETFSSLPPTSIRNFTTQTVGPELVTLKAELNPNGQSATYTIHYGNEAGEYTEGFAEGSLPISNEFKQVEATFTGLQPNTEYHYQLVAVSANEEEVHSADQVFRTEESAAEERAKESCPNTNLREENNSVALADCRAYEQVSPVDKRGGEAILGGVQLAPSGERAGFGSVGSFSNPQVNEAFIYYVAHRTATGWLSQAVLGRPAPFGTEPVGFGAGFLGEYLSPELDRWIFAEVPGLNSGEAHGGTMGYLSMGFADGSYLLHATPNISLVESNEERPIYSFLQVEGSADDLSRLFITTGSRLLPSPEDERLDDNSGNTTFTRIYEVSGADGPSPTMSLVAEVPLGLKGSGCAIRGEGTQGRTARLTSSDGTVLFYTIPIEGAAGADCGNGTPNPIGLFARIDGASPVQLNTPPPSQCGSSSPCHTGALVTPIYYGASPDGSRAWFSTTQPLIDSDTDTGNDLYLAKLENGQVGELVQASAGKATPTHPNPGEGANLIGTVEVSQDASHAAFVATGDLTTEENSVHESAAPGAYNLYVSGPSSGEVKFVARLCSGSEKSGSVKDPGCSPDLNSTYGIDGNNDYPLWLPGGGNPPAHFTPDGRYLVFTSIGRLTPDDTDNVADLYRYDFQTGQLQRLSFGRNGNDGNGNDNQFPIEIGVHAPRGPLSNELTEDGYRSISADGGVVVFQTAAPLVSRDTNTGVHGGCHEVTVGTIAVPGTGCDIYEWEEDGHGTCQEAGGCIGLVSSGLAPQGDKNGVISASGRDITFETRRNLIPADTDGVGDVYDARREGGFHTPHPPAPCGSPEACRPPPAAQPAAPVLGTPQFIGSGNQATQLKCSKGRHRVKKHGEVRCVRSQHKKHHLTKKHHHRKRSASHKRGGGK
jgi:hypothetical protein